MNISILSILFNSFNTEMVSQFRVPRITRPLHETGRGERIVTRDYRCTLHSAHDQIIIFNQGGHVQHVWMEIVSNKSTRDPKIMRSLTRDIYIMSGATSLYLLGDFTSSSEKRK